MKTLYDKVTGHKCPHCGLSMSKDFDTYQAHLLQCRLTRIAPKTFVKLDKAVKDVIIEKGEERFARFFDLTPKAPSLPGDVPITEIELLVSVKPTTLTTGQVDALLAIVDQCIERLIALEVKMGEIK